MNLRDYQLKIRESILKEWQEVDSTLVESATGTGKTRMAASIAEAMFPKRTLFIAHRKELIHQAAHSIQDATGLRCEIEMGEYKSSEHFADRSPVIVSSVQTLTAGGDGGGRMGKFDPNKFGCVICDECHHAVAASWLRVINYFRTNPELKVLGITATPDRADEEALGKLFKTVAYSYKLYDPEHIEPNAIDDGWLVFPRQKFVPIAGLDFSHVHTTAGDLNGQELAQVMEREHNIAGVVHPVLEFMFGLPQHTLDQISPPQWGDYIKSLNRAPKRTLGFTVSVAQAEMISEIFNRVQPGLSSWVCGKTPDDERRQILKRFDDGLIPCVWNCNCLTEGFDSPDVELVVDASPTKSRARYAQRVGRGTRPHSTIANRLNDCANAAERKAMIAASPKPFCTVLDFLGNSGKHKLICLGDILGGNVSDEVLERAINRVKEQGEGRFDEVIEEEEKKLAEERKQAELARRAKLVYKSKFSVQDVDPFDILQVQPVKERGWDNGKVLTEKQRNLLLKQGIDPDAVGFTAAKQLIGELMHRWDAKLCSFKQAKLLKRHGYNTNMSMEEASRTIDILAANNWRRPLAAKPPPPAAPAPQSVGEPF